MCSKTFMLIVSRMEKVMKYAKGRVRTCVQLPFMQSRLGKLYI